MKKSIFLLFWCAMFGFTTLAQKPVLTIPSGQNSWITAFKISPNGKYLVAAAMDRSIKIYDLKAKREVFTFWGHKDNALSLAITPDSKTIISGDFIGNLIFWDLNSGKVLKIDSTTHVKNISTIDISPDGKNLLTGDWGGVSAYWDLKKKDTLYSYRNNDYPIIKGAFFNNGQQYFAISPDTSKIDTLTNIIVAKSADAEVIYNLYFSSALLSSASVSKDGKSMFFLTHSPSEIRSFDLLNNKMKFKFSINEGFPVDVETLDENKILIVLRNEKRQARFLIFDVNQQKIIKKIETEIFISDNLYNTINVQVNPNNSNEINFITGYNLNVYSLNISKEKITVLNFKKSAYQGNPLLINNQLYLGGEDNIFKKWDVKTNELTILFTDTAHLYNVDDFDKKIIISSYKKWMIWDKESNKVEKTIYL
jgi:WD40 repeat protein